MTRQLPDCRSCDSNHALEAVRTDGGGGIVCFCNSCGKEAVVKDGLVVWPPQRRKTDVLGGSITGP